MNYEHWCRILDRDILLKWETEIILNNNQRVLRETYRSFSQFIENSFDIYSSKDGSRFWIELFQIHERRQHERRQLERRMSGSPYYNPYNPNTHYY